MRRILLIDNYDSFTFNLVEYLAPWAERLVVVRHDEITVGDLAALRPCAVMVSPGPGRPGQSGCTPEAVAFAATTRTPYLGVCLGHQALGEHWGWRLVQAREIVHGKASRITHDGAGVFEGLPPDVEVGRYHSLALLGNEGCPHLMVTARTAEGEVMGIRHRNLPMEGIQFHPESILTPHGRQMLENFMRGLENTSFAG